MNAAQSSAMLLLVFVLLVPPTTVAAPINTAQEGYTHPDPVSGVPTINILSLEDEVSWGNSAEKEWIKSEEAAGCKIDASAETSARVDGMLKRIAQVCHLPGLPWRIHVSSRPDWNAHAHLGALVSVYQGLLDDASDTELAGVLSHEIAHVTCRHSSETITHQKIAGLASKRAHSEYYKASYTTEQEAEADKVGLLYMALAGFDPRAITKLWERMNKKQGSNPGDYTYDHPLNAQRAQMTREWGNVAVKYFAGEGKINPSYGEILVTNDLVPRIGSAGDETVDFLSAALLEHLKYRGTKKEAEQREEAAVEAKKARAEADKAQLERKQRALEYIKIKEVFLGKTTKGKPGVFARINNGSNLKMKSIIIQFSYKTTRNTWEKFESPTKLENLDSGKEATWGLEITDPRFFKATFSARIIDLDY